MKVHTARSATRKAAMTPGVATYHVVEEEAIHMLCDLLRGIGLIDKHEHGYALLLESRRLDVAFAVGGTNFGTGFSRDSEVYVASQVKACIADKNAWFTNITVQKIIDYVSCGDSVLLVCFDSNKMLIKFWFLWDDGALLQSLEQWTNKDAVFRPSPNNTKALCAREGTHTGCRTGALLGELQIPQRQ